METRPKADTALGWAWRPDSQTNAALTRGRAKLKEHPELGSDRPHYGGDIVKALAEEKRKGQVDKPKRRRKKMAKKVTLKELSERKGKVPSKKKTLQAKTPSKKKLKTNGEDTGKRIPLKRICDELDLDPKATRVKLRRAIASGKFEFHDHSQRWEFNPRQAKEVRDFLAE